MAKISMTPQEPLKIIHLIETMFPGVKLDVMTDLLKDTELNGNLTISKKLNNESVVLNLEIK